MTPQLKDSLFYALLFIFIFYAGFTDADAKERPIRIGVTGGQTTIKNSATQDYQVATHIGVIARVDLVSIKTLVAGAEGRYSQTTAQEDVTNLTDSTTAQYEEVTRSLYLTARNRGDIYLRAKVGAVNRVIKTDSDILADTTKPSAGLAIGITTPQGTILELDFTIYDEDTSVFSIGYLF